MPEQQKNILVVAGEPSGDMHAAHAVSELRKLRPDTQVDAMGGDALKAAGARLIVDNRDLAVVGLFEVIRHYPMIRRALNTLKSRLETHPPDLLVLVDYVEFNLKLAKHAKTLGIPVLFYVSPQVWAWRQGRVKTIGQRIDMMAVIFPFETKFYEQHGIPVRYVGNPLVGKVKPTLPAQQVRKELNLDSDDIVIGLQPGSRRSEVERLLPLFLDAARLIREQQPDARFILPIAPGIDRESITSAIPDDLPVTASDRFAPYDLMQVCDAIITASGTATLETALMKIPMVISYRVSWLSYQIFRRLIRIPDIGLANIVAGKRVVPELIQDQATPENLATEILNILREPSVRQQMLEGFDLIRRQLGERIGSVELAQLIDEMLVGKPR